MVGERGWEGGREGGRKGGRGKGLHLVLLPVHQDDDLRFDSLHKVFVLSVINVCGEGDGFHAVPKGGREGGGEGGRKERKRNVCENGTSSLPSDA